MSDLRGDALQHSDRGGADSDDPAASRFGFVDCTRGCFAQLITLVVHDVSGDGLGLHRCESSEADMQGEKANLHAASGNFGQQRFGEMQASSWGRDRAGRLREDGLISLAVLFHFGCCPCERCREAAGLRPDRSSRSAMLIAPPKRKRRWPSWFVSRTVARTSVGWPSLSRRMILRSHPRSFPGTDHDPPIVGRVLLEQQDFKPPARVSIHAAEASGDHA